MYAMLVFSENMSARVIVKQGTLQGKECLNCNGKRYYSFEGIPYAKPPVGSLRFRDPQEPESWTGIRDATKPGNKCAQMDPLANKPFEGSEDCLYLNVYTPNLPADKIEKLPVLVFVHGGRFLVGYGDYYRPDYFIENDVVLVTINYRLHILGFISLHIPEAPGNAAAKDMVMALKWVKSNIEMFNGDPNNIVGMGESAGAGLIACCVTSKMAFGLLDKMIAQSGTCLSDLLMIEEDPIEKARTVALNLGKDLTDPYDLYKFLKDVPIEDLIYATMAAEINRPPYITNSYFLPVVEKKFDGVTRFFEEYPLATVLKNEHKKMPFLSGLTSHEGALFIRRTPEGKFMYITDLQRFIPRFIGFKYDSPKSKNLTKKLKNFYFKDKPIDDSTKVEYLNFVSDANFNRDIATFSELYSRNWDHLYFYRFAYSGNMNTRVMKQLGIQGASHGDSIQYQFYKKSKAEKCSKKDLKIVQFMSEAWCNFAKNGKPSSRITKLDWPAYTPDRRLCMNIDEELSVTTYAEWPRIKFWLDNMGERSKL